MHLPDTQMNMLEAAEAHNDAFCVLQVYLLLFSLICDLGLCRLPVT
jgi:hypothetical protein